MSKDPAFLFYPGDWLGGTMLMSRLHKGAYMDVLMAQYNNGHMSEDQIKILLGKEDENLWETVLKSKFKQDSEGKFYNERLDKEIIKRRKFTESRKNNLNKSKPDMDKHMETHMDIHMENENENINRNINKNKKGGAGGKKDFIDKIINSFQQAYEIKFQIPYSITNLGKDRDCAKSIFEHLKEVDPSIKKFNTEQALEYTSAYFTAAVCVKDEFIQRNMSLPIILSQFNKINNILKNGNQQFTGKGGATLTEINTILTRKGIVG